MKNELDEIARRQMAAAMRGHMGSVYRPDGELDPSAVARMGSAGGSVGLGEYLDMGMLTHVGVVSLSLHTPGGNTIAAQVPFDGDHAARLSYLATYIATLPSGHPWGGVAGGPLSVHDQKVLHGAAVLYALGGATGGKSPFGYRVNAERSAAMASDLLHSGIGAGTYWGRTDTRDDVCRIIHQHVDEERVRQDPRLQVFVDALRFELCRIDVNGGAGMQVLQAFLHKSEQQKFYFGWSRSRDNLLAWMRSVRGWK